MQVIQQYANGMNPEVPPYLALGELQRREMAQKQMAIAQGGQQGPQPSVKEQIEQKTGLMAAQALQQQQMQQPQPQGPMPAPAGVPQPEPQPQAPPPEMMARGGLTSIPVRRDMFEYAGGGIIAFAEGDPVKDPRRERKAGESFADFRKRMFDLDLQLQREKNAAEASSREAERQKRLAERGDVIPPSPFMERPPLPAPSASPANATAETMRRVGPMTAPKFEDPRMAGLPGAAQQMGVNTPPPPAPRPPAPAAPRPPMAAAAPAAPQAAPPAAAMTPQDEVAKLSLEAVREKAKAMTPEEAMAQEGKFASQYGLDKKFGEEERGLLALMKQRQADYAKNRPMEELSATLRGFGQGYGGASAAGERAGRETYDMDMANQREMLNAINAINKENLATGKERYKTGSTLFGKSEESTAAANRERTQTLGQMRGQDMLSATATANRLSDMERARMDRAVRLAEINNPGSSSNIRTEYLKMMDQVFDLESKGKTAEAESLRKRAEARLTASSGAAAGVGGERNDIARLKTLIAGYSKDLDPMSDTSDEEKKFARAKLKELRVKLENAEGGGAGGGPFTVTAGGKTYTFPTQEAANKFKAEAGVK